jgi:hypothetical protein
VKSGDTALQERMAAGLPGLHFKNNADGKWLTLNRIFVKFTICRIVWSTVKWFFGFTNPGTTFLSVWI